MFCADFFLKAQKGSSGFDRTTKKSLLLSFQRYQMPENRQVLRNADSTPSGDNIEGGADFSGDSFSSIFLS